jgi:hypothetical protein
MKQRGAVWKRLFKMVASNNVTAVMVTILLVSVGVPAHLASLGGKVAEGAVDVTAAELCKGGACD